MFTDAQQPKVSCVDRPTSREDDTLAVERQARQAGGMQEEEERKGKGKEEQNPDEGYLNIPSALR